jgi:2-phospho-L-lactate guanylyltransferase
MSTWAIVPVKGFDHGKSRLGPSLEPHARHGLARALGDRVLHACAACTAIDHVLVASDSARVLTPSARVSLLLDAAPHPPFAGVLDAALSHAYAYGATRAVIAMGDLPLIEPRDIAELVGALNVAALVVAPDRSRRGVGAIGCRLPAPIPMQLGHRDSFARTIRTAHTAKANVALVHNPRLAQDLDTRADLNELRRGSGLSQPALAALFRA